jgi:hypothetical protein
VGRNYLIVGPRSPEFSGIGIGIGIDPRNRSRLRSRSRKSISFRQAQDSPARPGRTNARPIQKSGSCFAYFPCSRFSWRSVPPANCRRAPRIVQGTTAYSGTTTMWIFRWLASSWLVKACLVQFVAMNRIGWLQGRESEACGVLRCDAQVLPRFADT